MKRRQIAIIILVVFVLLSIGCSSDNPSVTGEPQQQTQQIFVGSVNSNKYHYPTCQWARKIKPANEITFGSPEEARDAGYIPCKVCSPP